MSFKLFTRPKNKLKSLLSKSDLGHLCRRCERKSGTASFLRFACARLTCALLQRDAGAHVDVVDPDVSPGAVREEAFHHHLARPAQKQRGGRGRGRRRGGGGKEEQAGRGREGEAEAHWERGRGEGGEERRDKNLIRCLGFQSCARDRPSPSPPASSVYFFMSASTARRRLRRATQRSPNNPAAGRGGAAHFLPPFVKSKPARGDRRVRSGALSYAVT